MKRIIKLLTIIFMVVPSFVHATTIISNSAGGGVYQSKVGGSKCNESTINAKYTPCNNGNFIALHVQLVHYDGIKTEIIGNSAYVGTNTAWVNKVFEEKHQITYWDKLSGLSNNSDNLHSKLTTIFIKEDNLNFIFTKMGLDYTTFKNDVQNNKYPDHQRIGTNGVDTTGVRLIIEPIFTYYEVNGGKNSKYYYANSRGLASVCLQNLSNCNAQHIIRAAQSVKFADSDIGIYAGTMYEGTLEQLRDKYNNGREEERKVYEKLQKDKYSYGRMEIGIFDNIKITETRCNPDKDYSGYKSGIEYCCKTLGITENEQDKNITKKSDGSNGFVTRKLTNDELQKYCPSDNRCDPDKDGIAHCCKVAGIDSKNTANNITTNPDGTPGPLKRVIKSDELEKYCPVNEDTPDCIYDLQVESIKNCNNGNVGKISDSKTSWECAFKSEKSNFREVKTHFDPSNVGKFENDYCNIKCKEEISYEFPLAGAVVDHGRFLVVQESGIYPKLWPIGYTFDKVCRTSNSNGYKGTIDYDKFINDMNANEDTIKSNYDKYRVLQTKEQACKSVKLSGIECTDDSENSCCIQLAENSSSQTDGTASYDGKEYSCDYKVSTDSACYKKPDYTKDIEKAKKTYDKTIDKRNSLIDNINACSSNDFSEKIDIKLSMDYEEVVYNGTYDLYEADSSTTSSTTYYNSGTSYDDSGTALSSMPTSTIKVRDCKTDNCNSFKTKTYNSPKWVEYKYQQQKEYKLKDNLFRYVSKYSGQSYSSEAEAGDNYALIPCANLPVHYSASEGDKKFQINIESLSKENKFYKYLFSNNTFAGSSYSLEKEYECSYYVTTTTPSITDGSLLFRPISLDAENIGGDTKSLGFLKMDGSFREPGDNWNVYDNVNSYILNNRGKNGKEVYDLEPMYEVILSPSMMRRIRIYNRNQSGRTVTINPGSSIQELGILGYTDVDSLTCNNEGSECISNVIRNDWGVRGCVIDGSCD